MSLGEMVLKRGNRKYFEDQLIKQIMNKTRDIKFDKLYKEIRWYRLNVLKY